MNSPCWGGEPDASTTYELLEILEDPGLDGRPSGIDVHVAFGEGLLKRYRYGEDEPGIDNGLYEGRLEEALVRARFGRQLGETSDLSGELAARKRLFAPDEDPPEPSPWGLAARARWRTFVYGEHLDPRGRVVVVVDLGDRIVVGNRELVAERTGAEDPSARDDAALLRVEHDVTGRSDAVGSGLA